MWLPMAPVSGVCFFPWISGVSTTVKGLEIPLYIQKNIHYGLGTKSEGNMRREAFVCLPWAQGMAGISWKVQTRCSQTWCQPSTSLAIYISNCSLIHLSHIHPLDLLHTLLSAYGYLCPSSYRTHVCIQSSISLSFTTQALSIHHPPIDHLPSICHL